MKKRRNYSAEFKTKIVIELLKGNETLAEIAGRYGIHPNQLTTWKKTFLEKAPGVFSKKSSKEALKRESLEGDLYKKIGQLQIELDWLKKKSGHSL